MQLSRRFEVARPRDEIVERLCRDETLLELLPGGDSGDSEIVERDGDRRTTRTRYKALGREGVATFHFTFLLDGNVRFEKVCDGNVWRRLEGLVSVEPLDDEVSEVRVELTGATKTLVPEFAIKGPMEEQLREMSEALEDCLNELDGLDELADSYE